MKTKPMEDEEEINLVTLAQNYSDADTARALFESIRWPDGPVCPHCDSKDAYKIVGRPTSKSPTRKGLYKCKTCWRGFTVTVGTVMEDSHIPLGKWAMAFFLVGSSKKGISAHQMHRMLKVTYKTAWFMCHRIRYAMEQEHEGKLEGTVEADETFVGGKGDIRTRRQRKTPVVALIERGGQVRTKVVPSVNRKNLRQFLGKNIDADAILNTDEYVSYKYASHYFLRHDTVNHSKKEYARVNKDGTVSHVNTCESFFSLIKRGVYGTFHHLSKEHLPRYCAEFSFRWNHRHITDGERMMAAVESSEGKRLTYRETI